MRHPITSKQWIRKNNFSTVFGKIKFWTHHELEMPWMKILTIWCITQACNMLNEGFSTTSLHTKQWFHKEQEAKFK